MKIRLFENHMKDYYQRVNNVNILELNKDIANNGEWFSKREFIKIIDLVVDILEIEERQIHPDCQREILRVHINFVEISFRIIKMEDEWYWVNFQSDDIDIYYKCDQWEGLEMLLRNCDEMKTIASLYRKNTK